METDVEIGCCNLYGKMVELVHSAMGKFESGNCLDCYEDCNKDLK